MYLRISMHEGLGTIRIQGYPFHLPSTFANRITNFQSKQTKKLNYYKKNLSVNFEDF